MNPSKKLKSVLFSGIQPSGTLHIGAYLGALKHWVDLQNNYDCLFSIVDLHTITIRQNPEALRERCYDFLALYIASGIDPDKNIIFCQSHVPAHCQLAWILNCFVYMGELNRMTQFKDKAKKQGANVSVGLFDYPVLMAADILLYGAKLVPIGADQKQHLELTRDLALRFNNIFGKIFTLPEIFIPPLGSRIMALQEPLKKMSKSDENAYNTLNILDEPDMIIKKMQRAVTDSGKEIYFHKSKPGIANLLVIYSKVSGKTIQQLEKEYADVGYAKFKMDLAEVLIDYLQPIQRRYHILRGDKKAMDEILRRGAEEADRRATQVLEKIFQAVGFIMGK